jgi:hypothetical protein
MEICVGVGKKGTSHRIHRYLKWQMREINSEHRNEGKEMQQKCEIFYKR